MAGKIRVLLVDDSAVVRASLRAIFESDDAFSILGEAKNGEEAIAMTRCDRPDLITMDLEMPVMRGEEAIREIMSFRPTPILVVSDYTDAQNAYSAVSFGAIDVVAKPGLTDPEIQAFLERARIVSRIPVITHVKTLQSPFEGRSDQSSLARPISDALHGAVFAIASSTGGPQALAQILGLLPARFNSPILIAQHVIPGFAAGMARWLDTVSNLPVKLAEHGEVLIPGQVYLSPSEQHLRVGKDDRIELVDVREGDIYRPSCNVLLNSVAARYGQRSVGVILTGMGSDGVTGITSIRTAGGQTIAQDEASSVVFGMNRVAIESGNVQRVRSLDGIADTMFLLAEKGRA